MTGWAASGRTGQDFQPQPDWDEGFEFSGTGNGQSADADVSDFFEAMFGGERTGGHSWQTKRHRMGPERDARLADDLEDAYRGTQRPIDGQDHHASVVIDLKDRVSRRAVFHFAANGRPLRIGVSTAAWPRRTLFCVAVRFDLPQVLVYSPGNLREQIRRRRVPRLA